MADGPRIDHANRHALPFSVAPLSGVEPYESQPWNGRGPARKMVAWALMVDQTVVEWEFVMGDSPKAEIAKHLMRKWLGVRQC